MTRENSGRNAMGAGKAASKSFWSRRAAIGAAVQGAAGALLFCAAGAQAADKMTRAQAEYQDTPNGIYSCSTCTLFEAPNSCKVVEGEVSKDGWCKAFALAD
jgi:hypothetical protein